MKQTILIFGGLAVVIMLLFKLNQYTLTVGVQNEVMSVAAGVLFMVVGFFLSRFLNKSKEVKQEKNDIDRSKIQELGLSKREFEILKEMALGLSNSEIGSKLFISENTVKTHVSRILSKLQAKRRTQAIQMAREMNIL